jgi:nardilysin
LQLPSDNGLLHNAIEKNKSEENFVVENYFQVDQDIGQGSTRARAIIDLLEDIVYKPCLNQIRTKDQLGYVVDGGTRMTYHVLEIFYRCHSM